LEPWNLLSLQACEKSQSDKAAIRQDKSKTKSAVQGFVSLASKMTVSLGVRPKRLVVVSAFVFGGFSDSVAEGPAPQCCPTHPMGGVFSLIEMFRQVESRPTPTPIESVLGCHS
jgi:hypothetical protein